MLENVLEQFDMHNSKPTYIPHAKNHGISIEGCLQSENNRRRYMLYVMKLDICYGVHLHDMSFVFGLAQPISSVKPKGDSLDGNKEDHGVQIICKHILRR